MTQTTEIIHRNLFYELRNEHFNENLSLEPMSKWKEKKKALLKDKIAAEVQYDENQYYTLSNTLLEKRRQRIFEDERHSIDTSIESLRLLNIIIFNIWHIQQSGLSFTGIIAIGKYLRQKGDKVDYVKLDNWLSKLHVRNYASLLSSILHEVFGFDKSELPFLYKVYNNNFGRLAEQLGKESDNESLKLSLSSIMMSPLGAIGQLQQRTRKMLDNIEE